VRLLTHAFILSAIAVILALFYISPLTFSPKGSFPLFAMILTFAVIARYCWFRHMGALAVALECVTLGTLLIIPMLMAAYLAASLDMPLADGGLTGLDAALGFDWRGYIAFLNAHPTLAMTLKYTYGTLSPQLVALPFILAAVGKFERAYAMIAAFALLCLISCLISIWFPALGTYLTYGVHEGEYRNVDSYYGFQFLRDFLAVREQPNFVLSIDSMSGIITFPSDHAAIAALCVWAAWGVKSLRIPFLVLNVLMAASAVANANHYLIDVIAGLVVAVVSILAVKAAFARLTPIGRVMPPSAKRLAYDES
jgi:membrane-associated phospholipid phosphatase